MSEEELPSPHTSLKVDPQEKKEWLQAINDGDYDDISDLIKTSVRHELDDEFGFVRQQQDNTQEVNVDLSSIESKIDSLTQQVAQIQTDINTESESSETSIERGSDEFYRVVGQVEDTLPLVDSEDELRSLEVTMELPIHERAKITGHPEDIAAAINYDSNVVREACAYLVKNKNRVKSIAHDSQMRFFEVKNE